MLAEEAQSDARMPFYVTGGTMPPDAPSYIERQADSDLHETLLRGEFCYVLNARQMGKSSLCIRALQRLRDAGILPVFLDLTQFGGSNLTPEQWYGTLLAETGRELNLRKECLRYFKQNGEFGPMHRFFSALREVCLAQTGQPIVVFVDEIDMTRSLPFSADEFFAGIRECYTSRAVHPELNRLTFCLLGTATPAELIRDSRITPFNIGKRIRLSDFTPQEAALFAPALPGGATTLNRVLYWTGGHPYLTQTLSRAVMETNRDADALVSEIFLSHTARDSEANLTLVRDRLLRSDADQFALLTLYRQILQGKKVLDDDTNPLCDVLKLSGVVRVELGWLVVRNEIYRRVFDSVWIDTHLPGAEVRRQKVAFRRGVWNTAGWLAVLVQVFHIGMISSEHAQHRNLFAEPLASYPNADGVIVLVGNDLDRVSVDALNERGDLLARDIPTIPIDADLAAQATETETPQFVSQHLKTIPESRRQYLRFKLPGPGWRGSQVWVRVRRLPPLPYLKPFMPTYHSVESVTVGLPLRMTAQSTPVLSRPDPVAEELFRLRADTVVALLEEPTAKNPFAFVRYQGKEGYVRMDDLTPPPPPTNYAGYRVVNEALRWVGVPQYKFGGANITKAVDTSHFMASVFRRAGVPIPDPPVHNQEMYGEVVHAKAGDAEMDGRRVHFANTEPWESLRPGDRLIFQNKVEDADRLGNHHTAIYVGRWGALEHAMVHCSSAGNGVTVDRLERYWTIYRFAVRGADRRPDDAPLPADGEYLEPPHAPVEWKGAE